MQAHDPLLVPVYLVYTAIAIGLIVWLARTLSRNGAIFLEGVFEDSPRMAGAVNQLLVVGFYMLNLGYAALLLRADAAPDAVVAVEVLVHKLGILLLSLGVLHFANMYVFHRIRRRASAVAPPPPAAPQGFVDADGTVAPWGTPR
ncbi:MAG: hypothetical protein KY454_10105 [Actinobacteria bacterium]|nr:hypothetical protein [Actinomycetota bacterium]MBW3650309.1 hypothetical protein [Actinomycetota bacterium]